jgi:hypothetical protein
MDYSHKKTGRRKYVVGNAIADLSGINFIESYMESILRQAATVKTEEEKIYFWSKYIRFWEMMKMLRDTAYVNRRDMVNSMSLS